MCGINGILRLDDSAAPVDPDELARTRDAMALRGPDGVGLFVSPDGSLGLGHRRLAIIDLSPAGLQPMSHRDGRYRIVFNGEIYNYRELRADLLREGALLRSHSDTEVILALYERHGAGMLARLRGMYALAIWDEVERRLFLARDPNGIKPLYLCRSGGYLRFASQVRALEASGKVSTEVDPAGLVGFLLWGSVPEPRTLRRDIASLPAGTFLVVERGTVGEPRAFRAPASDPAREANDLGTALLGSVRAHLEADVPVGVFLSSGLDSALIASLVRTAAGPPTTLTLTFDELVGTASDEGPLAAEVAKTLGTNHIERRVGRSDFLDLWPRAIAAMDQPSIDGFNSYVVSRVAHEAGFKVVLSGLGGDELFGSYASFRDVPEWSAWARRLGAVPGLSVAWPGLAGLVRPNRPKLRSLLSRGRTLGGAYFLRRGLYLPEEIPGIVGEEIARAGFAASDPEAVAEAALRAGAPSIPTGVEPRDAWEAVHVLETTLYMRNQLLRDADWASMASSLELRVPLVDPWLQQAAGAVAFAPARRSGKAELVRRLAPELPSALFDRPKTGFTIPVMRWLEDTPAGTTTPGLDSRRLALRVLSSFGVEVREPSVRFARAAL